MKGTRVAQNLTFPIQFKGIVLCRRTGEPPIPPNDATKENPLLVTRSSSVS